MKRKKRKKTHAIDAIASSECVISGKAKEIKDVRRLKGETKMTVDECVSGANANARRSTSANAERKCEKEESLSGDDAMCFGRAKAANRPSLSSDNVCRESQRYRIAEDGGTGKLMRRESGLLRKAVQECAKCVSISLDGTAKDSIGTTKVKSATVKDSSGAKCVKSK